MPPKHETLPPPTTHELIARTRALTGAVPEDILRAQTTDVTPLASGHAPSSRTSPGKRWHCGITWHKGEYKALTQVHRLGMPAWCPLMLRQANYSGYRVDVIEPIFPGYLFVYFDPESDPWRRAYQAPALARFLCGPNRSPIRVPDWALGKLVLRGRPVDGVIDARTDEQKAQSAAREKRRQVKRAEPEVLFPSADVGQRVKVLSGPFDGFEGICTMSADNRIRLLMAILGANREVEFTRDEVELVA